MEQIIKAIEQVTGMSWQEITSKSQKNEVVIARQLFCYYMRKLTKRSLAQIGRQIWKDHATVLHSVKAIENYIATKDICTLNMMRQLEQHLDIESSGSERIHLMKEEDLNSFINFALSKIREIPRITNEEIVKNYVKESKL